MVDSAVRAGQGGNLRVEMGFEKPVGWVLFGILHCVRIAGAAPEAIVHAVEGEVTVIEPGNGVPTAVFGSMSLHLGSRIQTGERGSCTLIISDVAIVDLEPMTVFKLPEVDVNQDTITRVELEYGGAWSLVESLGSGQGFEVQTRIAIGGVRGTQFRTFQDPNSGESGFTMVEGFLDVLDLRTRRPLRRRLEAGSQATFDRQGRLRGVEGVDVTEIKRRFPRFVRSRSDLPRLNQWRKNLKRGPGPLPEKGRRVPGPGGLGPGGSGTGPGGSLPDAPGLIPVPDGSGPGGAGGFGPLDGRDGRPLLGLDPKRPFPGMEGQTPGAAGPSSWAIPPGWLQPDPLPGFGPGQDPGGLSSPGRDAPFQIVPGTTIDRNDGNPIPTLPLDAGGVLERQGVKDLLGK